MRAKFAWAMAVLEYYWIKYGRAIAAGAVTGAVIYLIRG